MNLFGEGAEIMSDLSACHFEQSFYDVWGMCQENKELCAMSQLTENLSKNMFVLMGKLTAMAETMKDFKVDEDGEAVEMSSEDYYEEMREIGTDAGTFYRTIYNYQTPEQMEKASKKEESTSRRHHGH